MAQQIKAIQEENIVALQQSVNEFLSQDKRWQLITVDHSQFIEGINPIRAVRYTAWLQQDE